MKTLYQLLDEKKKKRTSFVEGEEYSFFIKNRRLLDHFPQFLFLYNSEKNDFDVMRANIILQSYLSKILLEKEVDLLEGYRKKNINVDSFLLLKSIHEKIADRPFLQDGMNRVYIAFFTKALNNIYINDPEKLLQNPYKRLRNSFTESLIDPFDMFGYKIYNSKFTRLVMVKEDQNKKEAAFFHYDTNTIYFVNNQGRLDNKLVLFDKYIHHPMTTHMLERIMPVVDAYFAYDRSKMIESLHENNFISGRLMSILRKTTGRDDDF